MTFADGHRKVLEAAESAIGKTAVLVLLGTLTSIAGWDLKQTIDNGNEIAKVSARVDDMQVLVARRIGYADGEYRFLHDSDAKMLAEIAEIRASLKAHTGASP